MEWQGVCVLTPDRSLPILAEVEVCVVVGGEARVAAVETAARHGRRFWSSNAMAFAAAMRSAVCRARSAGCICPPSAKSISPSRWYSVSPSASAPPWRHAAGFVTVLSFDGGLGYREIEGAQVRAQLNRDGARLDA
jgi:hypothetical protein